MYEFAFWYACAAFFTAAATALIALLLGQKSDGSETATNAHWVTVKGHAHVRNATAREAYEHVHGAGSYARNEQTGAIVRVAVIGLAGLFMMTVGFYSATKNSHSPLIHNVYAASVGGFFQLSTLLAAGMALAGLLWLFQLFRAVFVAYRSIAGNAPVFNNGRLSRRSDAYEAYGDLDALFIADLVISIVLLLLLTFCALFSMIYGTNYAPGFSHGVFYFFKAALPYAAGAYLLWFAVVEIAKAYARMDKADRDREASFSQKDAEDMLDRVNTLVKNGAACTGCGAPLTSQYTFAYGDAPGLYCTSCRPWLGEGLGGDRCINLTVK